MSRRGIVIVLLAALAAGLAVYLLMVICSDLVNKYFNG